MLHCIVWFVSLCRALKISFLTIVDGGQTLSIIVKVKSEIAKCELNSGVAFFTSSSPRKIGSSIVDSQVPDGG